MAFDTWLVFLAASIGLSLSPGPNGLLALKKMEVFNRYDRVTLSFPSFDPTVYQAMMGLPRPPDLAAILARASEDACICVLHVPTGGDGRLPETAR